MNITKVEAIPFHIPFDPDLHLKYAYRTAAAADHVLVRVYTNNGIVGISEAPARPQIYGETQESIVAIVEKYLGPPIVGKDPFNLDCIHHSLDSIPHNLCAKAAIDIAIHDIIGKYLNIPVYNYIGGKTRDSIPLSWMVGVDTKERMVSECQKFLAMGIGAFKIKAGLDFDEDIERFKAIRNSLGNKVILYVDPNQTFKGTKRAVTLIRELEKYGLAWIEEPSPIFDKRSRLEISKSISVPILGDESCTTPLDVAQELELGAIGIVMIKVARTGFHKTKKIIYMCQEAGIPCLIGSAADSSIGAAASAQVAVAFRNVIFPSEISYHLRMKGDLLIDPPRFHNGYLSLPEKPGLGIEVNENALNQYRV